jgi:hypothetical protein
VCTELGHSNNYIQFSRDVPILKELHHLIGLLHPVDELNTYREDTVQCTSLTDVSRPWTACRGRILGLPHHLLDNIWCKLKDRGGGGEGMKAALRIRMDPNADPLDLDPN